MKTPALVALVASLVMTALFSSANAFAQSDDALSPIAESDIAMPTEETSELRIRARDAAGQQIPCRIRVYEKGNPAPIRQEVTNGGMDCSLDAGEYRIVVSRGPEYSRVERQVTLNDGETKEELVVLKPLTDMGSHGWYSGDLHVHLLPEQIETHMRAEDLNICPAITHWMNGPAAGVDLTGTELLQTIEGQGYAHLLSEEHELGGTSMIYHNLREPLIVDHNIVGAIQKFRALGGWAEIEKPYIWDTPAALTTGLVDSVEIAANANSWWLREDFIGFTEIPWGRPRDRNEYPGPGGYARYNLDLYNHFLNCGFRIVPTAGTAIGVPDVPVGLGYCRVYVHCGEEFTYDNWWESLADGRAFVTTGPLMLMRANGVLPGEILASLDGSPIEVSFVLELLGNDPIATVEVVRDGEVIQRIEGEDLRGTVDVEPITIERSAWFVVRAFSRIPYNTIEFVCSAPYYVEIGKKRSTIHRDDVKFMMQWLDERTEQLDEAYEGKPEHTSMMKHQSNARKYYEKLLEDAVDD